MKAAVYYENGPPSVLKYEDVPDPVSHPQSIIIKVEAVSVEGGDTLNRLGGALATHPHIVGYQAAGTVIDVGSEVKHFKLGQKVVTVNAFGSHAALRSVFALTAWPIPDGFDVKQAAAMPVPFGTADDCLFARRMPPAPVLSKSEFSCRARQCRRYCPSGRRCTSNCRVRRAR